MMRTAALWSLAVLAAAPLAAQQPARHGMAGMHGQGAQGMQGMAMMDSMMGPMMQAMASVPEHLLMQKDKLHLTADQQSRLTALRDAGKAAHDQAASQAAMHLREMVQAMHAAQPDTNAVRTHFNAAFRFMQAAHWAMVKNASLAWPILTAAQQHQVESDTTGGMMMRQGGMRH